MSMEGISAPTHLVQNVRERTDWLLEECRLTRSRAAELRLHSQDLQVRAQALRARTSFITVLAEPLPKCLPDAVSGGPPMNDTDQISETAKLNQTTQRAKEFSRQAAHMAGEASNQAVKAHRRAQQAHGRMEDARQNTEGIHTQSEATHQHTEDAHQKLKRDDKIARRR
ncbi:hypothetical protein [Azospirillum brasilense]|uniref:hypothetical protein n=1 Tax=Azospirillum brasilense TaxID=192 RepID=UPI00117827D3|nr:hypothetical protein [Azospirillum brasilense]